MGLAGRLLTWVRGDQITASSKPHPLDLDGILPKIMSVRLHTAEEWGTGVGEWLEPQESVWWQAFPLLWMNVHRPNLIRISWVPMITVVESCPGDNILLQDLGSGNCMTRVGSSENATLADEMSRFGNLNSKPGPWNKRPTPRDVNLRKSEKGERVELGTWPLMKGGPKMKQDEQMS